MPVDIKKASVAIIISLIASLAAVYVNGLEYEGYGFDDLVILGVNVIWGLVIAWVLWDLFRGKDIRWTLILVGLVMMFFLIWEIIDFGYGLAQGFYTLELVMFVVAYFFIKSPESKKWYENKNA